MIPPYTPDVRCGECGRAFTDDEWEVRHWRDSDQADVHEACCRDCHNNE